MSVRNARDDSFRGIEVPQGGRHDIRVFLTDEQFAALEGWRSANGVETRADAVRELVRIGLLSEIARIYRMVSGACADNDEASEAGN